MRDARAGRRERSRSLLSALLATQLGVDPSELHIELSENGKPRLAAPTLPDGEELHFSVSHSGALAALALAPGEPVGIDVELVGRAGRRERDWVAIARRAFGEATAARLAGLGGEAREREFLRLWVRHEAALKCRGEGLGFERGAEAPSMWVVELEPGQRTIAALATEAQPAAIRCLRWCGA